MTDIQELTPEQDRRVDQFSHLSFTPGSLANSLALGAYQGRDVSAYDSNVPYSNYKFIINKVTEGSNYVSPGWQDRRKAAKAAGCVYGAYHFARPGNGAQQADFFLSVAGEPTDDEMAVFIDAEVSGVDSVYRDAFCNEYQRQTGVPCNLYTYLNFYQTVFGSSRGPCRYLWGAQYGVASPATHFDIWQWQGGPDLDTSYVDLSTLTTGSVRGNQPSKWRPVDNVDNTVWVWGRAPVLALEKRPYPSTTAPVCADMRKQPADRCANDKTGVTQDWADYLYDGFAAIPYTTDENSPTWAEQFNLVQGDTWGEPLFEATNAWGKLHGSVRTGGDSGDWALWWGHWQGQIHS